MDDLQLFERVLIRCGRIAQRGDVEVISYGSWSGSVASEWKDLPADLLEFYTRLNGMFFVWKFLDDDQVHGLRLFGLVSDRRLSVNPVTRTSYPLLDKTAFAGDHKSLIFEGTGEEGLILRVGAEANVLNRFVRRSSFPEPAQSFTELIERGLESGFASGWNGMEPDCTAAVTARLDEPVAPRESFVVTLEEVEELSASKYRQIIAGDWQKGRFDKVMKALGRKEKARDFSSTEDRGRHFDEVVCDSSAITAKQAAEAMKLMFYSQKATKKDFDKRLRCGGAPLMRVRLHCKYLRPPGQLPLSEEHMTIQRILHDHPDLHVSDDSPGNPELLRYCYPPKLGVYYQGYEKIETVAKWKGRGERETTVEMLLDPERARGMESGMTWVSGALASPII